MVLGLVLNFTRPPSVVAYMARALYPSPGLSMARGFPVIQARWSPHRVNQFHLAEFLRMTGLSTEHGLPILYPQVFAFRLQMVIVTHPAFPLPIWGALQVRNNLLQHQGIPLDAQLDVETKVAGQRFLGKGAEVDLHTTLHSEGKLVWEGLTTFHYRGRFGGTDAPSPFARGPEEGGDVTANWTIPSAIGWRFGGLTGDYNGLHYWSWYARRLGFSRAFHHPQHALGQCLARLRLPEPVGPQRLDTWLKGPVYYDAEVRLRTAMQANETFFALHTDADPRPAIVGRYGLVGEDHRLLNGSHHGLA